GIEDPEKSQDQSYKPVSPNNFSGPSSQPNSNGPSGPSNEDDPSRAPSGNGPSSTPSGYGTSTTTSNAPSGDDPSSAPSGDDQSSTSSGYGTSTTPSTAPSGDDPSSAPSGNDPSSTPSGYGTSTTTSTAPSGDDPSGALSANDASRTSSGRNSPTSPSGDEPSSAPSRSSRPAQHIKSVEDATKFTTQQATGDIREWLDGHNLYRSRYGAPDLKWDSSLANQAQGVANSCRWRHTANNPSGENIAAGQESASDTVIAWVEGPDEKESYDPASPQFSHFTQVVWESTTHVGCATVSCSDIQGASLPQSPVDFYVCEYAPKGNIYGQFRENVKSAKGGQPLGSNTVYPNRSKSLGTSYYFPAPEG
ncbi:CAP domain-containing protein, partial [Melampsora americana]